MIGIDEVGRGAWAGPLLVVAARVKEAGTLPPGLTDSKLLSKKQRETLYEQLLITCEFGEGWVYPEELDQIGLGGALRLAAMRSVGELNISKQDRVCIDGNINLLKDAHANSYTQIKADLTVPIVSAASVYAKVMRDRYMARLRYDYPDYLFEKHVGYGTKKHREALAAHGVTPYHRKSFKPIQRLLL